MSDLKAKGGKIAPPIVSQPAKNVITQKAQRTGWNGLNGRIFTPESPRPESKDGLTLI